MNRKKLFVSNGSTMKKARLQKFLQLNVSRNCFVKCITYNKQFDFMLPNLLHAKFCLFVFDATLLLLHRVGSLLTYEALLVANFWEFKASVAE